MNTTCPRCNSDNTSSYQMIYSGGTATGSFKALSYGLNSGAIGTGGKTKSQTLLAQQTTPPPIPTIEVSQILFAVLAGILVFIVFSSATGVGLIGLGLGVAIAIIIIGLFMQRLQPQTLEWQKRIMIWQESWMCLKCGHSWHNKPKVRQIVEKPIREPLKRQQIIVHRTDSTKSEE